jgi:hypothetical protein
MTIKKLIYKYLILSFPIFVIELVNIYKFGFKQASPANLYLLPDKSLFTDQPPLSIPPVRTGQALLSKEGETGGELVIVRALHSFIFLAKALVFFLIYPSS